jgi:hypothetical protein
MTSSAALIAQLSGCTGQSYLVFVFRDVFFLFSWFMMLSFASLGSIFSLQPSGNRVLDRCAVSEPSLLLNRLQ